MYIGCGVCRKEFPGKIGSDKTDKCPICEFLLLEIKL